MTQFTRYNVAVVGCGTGGPTAALFLAQMGHEVTVFERVPNPGPVGAGILIQPTGMIVLARLGLLPAILTSGARIDRLYGTTAKGKVILNLQYKAYHPQIYGLGLHRGVLFTHLFTAVKRAGIPIHCGCEIVDLKQLPQGQTSLIDSQNNEHGPYDLIIIADGARSQLRQATQLPHQISRYPWGALWLIAPDPDKTFCGELSQVYAGTRQMVGFLPTGRGIDNPKPLVSMFWSIHLDQVKQWQAQPLASWKADVMRLAPQAASLLATITHHEQLPVASYYDIRLPTWNTEHVVLIGDAAHAMSPQLGQGANLALFDAMILADCLSNQPHLAVALNEYSQRRRAHLRYYQFVSRWLTPFFQSAFTPISWPRDWVFEPFSRFRFFKNQMVESLIGIKTGLFSKLPSTYITDFADMIANK